MGNHYNGGLWMDGAIHGLGIVHSLITFMIQHLDAERRQQQRRAGGNDVGSQMWVAI